MEQESTKISRKPLSSRFVQYVTIVCVLACLTFFFALFVLQNKRIDVLENELMELKKSQALSGDVDAKKPISRQERATDSITLPDLNKKFISLDSRYDRQIKGFAVNLKF